MHIISVVSRDITEPKQRERESVALVERLKKHTSLLGKIASSKSAMNGDIESLAGEATELLSEKL